MGGSVIRLEKGLMDLFQLCWRLRQGELVVKQAPLDVKVGLHQVFVAFALRADNCLMLNLHAPTDGFERVGGEGSATIRNQGLGGTLV